METWRALVNRAGLLPLAEIFSEHKGTSTVTSETPVLTGILANLERGIPARGNFFDALVQRIAALFTSYSLEDLERAKLALAPTECTINLDPLLHRLDPQAAVWTPEMLRHLPDELPVHTDLAVFGRGPGWLYGMLAAYAGQHAFYQFDPRIGWLAPPVLNASRQPSSDEITVHLREYGDAFILTTGIHNDYLDHLQAEQLTFPPVSVDHGLILDGKIPHWLLTALVRLYQKTGVAWIACHQPTLGGAVVIASRSGSHQIGELIPLPVSKPHM